MNIGHVFRSFSGVWLRASGLARIHHQKEEEDTLKKNSHSWLDVSPPPELRASEKQHCFLLPSPLPPQFFTHPHFPSPSNLLGHFEMSSNLANIIKLKILIAVQEMIEEQEEAM